MRLDELQRIADQIYADAKAVAELIARVVDDLGPDAEINIEELGDEAKAILDRVRGT